ncbi:MAG: hypothetical protein A2798_03970 [Candidatus Levybacteria bacterium RIFCSPHIGHO2_01_FULL_37_17]|nr:MAG: hypothetical protein A2798_03970 [Candidatus Levybacteria bacterium RIFCSPHIGHO2_01_FULL_37_17]OGH36625.1 MAG: hypothetical protein A2959_04025 [Candidatus Levybacteria bacterium RIFCSPLOWO2_01_FULL_38_23]
MTAEAIPQARHTILRDIERRFAQPVMGDETIQVINQIKSATIMREGVVVEYPPEDSKDFEKASIKDLSEAQLRSKLAEIFGVTHDKPKSVYFLSEEKSISAAGLTRFPFDRVLDSVVPYLKDWGQNTNYWITDGNTTVTFHRDGVMYWKVKPGHDA